MNECDSLAVLPGTIQVLPILSMCKSAKNFIFLICLRLDFLCFEDQRKLTSLLHDTEQEFQELPLLVCKTAKPPFTEETPFPTFKGFFKSA